MVSAFVNIDVKVFNMSDLKKSNFDMSNFLFLKIKNFDEKLSKNFAEISGSIF